MIPTNTDVTINIKARLAVGMEAIAVMVLEGATDAGQAGSLLAEDERQAVARLLTSGVSRGKSREVHFDLIHEPSQEKPSTNEFRRVWVAGLCLPAALPWEVWVALLSPLGPTTREARRDPRGPSGI